MAGMAIAIAATLMGGEVQSYGFIIAGVAAGALIGGVLAMRVEMTAMPQLVAALHSFVGMAAVLVAIGTYLNKAAAGQLNPVLMGELSAGIIIGAITFSGSVVAFAKLQGLVSGAPVIFKGQHALNALLAILTIGLGIHFGMTESMLSLFIMTALAFILGFTLIIPIGGADMPVIISMLNSYSGWAAAATGFTLHNNLLIIVGALVGFSGAILSFIMCRAMNRSIFNVIFGGFGSDDAGGDSAAAQAVQKGVKSASVEDAVYWMEDAKARHHHPRLRHGGGPGAARPKGDDGAAGGERRGGEIRHPPSGGAHAWSHERIAGLRPTSPTKTCWRWTRSIPSSRPPTSAWW